MAASLVPNYEFVSDLEVGAEELWDLLERVAETSGEQDVTVAPVQPSMRIEPSTPAEDISYRALAIRNPLGKLAAYASATLDYRLGQASIDCLVVDPDERNQRLGTVLADEGIRQLDREHMETVVFQNFGQLGWLMPHLISGHGFEYNVHDDEYVRRRGLAALPSATGEGMIHIPAVEAVRRPIGLLEMAAFRGIVNNLIDQTTAYALSNRILTDDYNDYRFRHAGGYVTVRRSNNKHHKIWQVLETDIAELVASDRGVVMAVEREYSVEPSALEGYRADYRDVQEIRGKDGAMRPFVPARDTPDLITFTAARFERIMKTLDRLRPSDLVQDFPEYR